MTEQVIAELCYMRVFPQDERKVSRSYAGYGKLWRKRWHLSYSLMNK